MKVENSTTDKPATAKIPADVHRAIKADAARRGVSIQHLITVMWEEFAKKHKVGA